MNVMKNITFFSEFLAYFTPAILIAAFWPLDQYIAGFYMKLTLNCGYLA